MLKCELCGFDKPIALVSHHKNPLSKGGSNDPSNIMVVCCNCHCILHHGGQATPGRATKKISQNGPGNSALLSLSPCELRMAGIKVRDTVDVDAERDRIVIWRISQESEE